MHSRLLSCIVLYTCDGETYVTCVLSTLIYIYVMSLGYANLLCFHVYFLVCSFDQLQSSGTDQTLSGGALDAGVPASGQLQRGSREFF